MKRLILSILTIIILLTPESWCAETHSTQIIQASLPEVLHIEKIIVEDIEHENVVDFEELSKESLVSTLIELSPKKINFYCDSDDTTVNFLSKIFEERVNINYNKSLKKLDNYSSIFK